MSLRTHLDRKGKYLWSRFLIYLDIQLFISLCSWPLLAAWGLPLSPAGIIGNLLFTPFLSLFLLLSSLIFFCTLLALPHGVLIILLEAIASCWYLLLFQSSRSWLFIGAHPPFYLTLIVLGLGCALMLTRSLTQKKRILLLGSIYITCGFVVPRYSAQKETVLLLPYATQELKIVRSHSSTLVVDPGVLGRTLAAQQLIQYTLIPFLIQKSITHLDMLIVSKPSYMTFKALASLIQSFPLGTIYMPAWQGTWYNAGWASWENLLRKAQEQKTTIVLIHNNTTVTCGTYAVHLSLSPTLVKRNKLRYHELTTTLVKS